MTSKYKGLPEHALAQMLDDLQGIEDTLELYGWDLCVSYGSSKPISKLAAKSVWWTRRMRYELESVAEHTAGEPAKESV